MSNFHPPAPFDPTREKWDSYMRRFECFLEANDMLGLTDNRKRAVFLSHCGPEVFDTAESLSDPTPVQTVPWQVLQATLKTHYAPTPSKVVRRYEFRQRMQQEGESINQYIAALHKASGHCEFRDLDDILLDQLICGVQDIRLQRRLLAKPNLTLTAALDEARAAESSAKAAESLHRFAAAKKEPYPSPTVHQGDLDDPESSDDDSVCRTDRRLPPQKDSPAVCASCGGRHPRASCRFRDVICQRCEKRGHLARVCRAILPKDAHAQSDLSNRSRRQIRKPRQKPTPSQPETNQTRIARADCRGNKKKIMVIVSIEGAPIEMEVDTGSAVSIVAWQTLKLAIPSLRSTRLRKTTIRLSDYQGNRIPVKGQGSFTVKFNAFTGPLQLTIVDGDLPSLLGLDWFDALGLGVTGVNAINTGHFDDIFTEFQDVFSDGLGKYVGTPISFNLDPNVAPIRLKPRRVPLPLREKIDKELDKLIRQGVLEPVDHAKWETPIVTPIKSDGSVRICADYKCTLNKALQQSAYPVPIVHHLLHSLGPGRLFARLDLAQAYQQLPVDGATAEAQTIVTHRGAFKCRRLQFGVSVAPGLFQSVMERLLQNIPGVVPYFDDILISACDQDQLRCRVRMVLSKLRAAGLKAKRSKCLLGVPEVEFLGYRINGQGIHPTESKLRAIHEAPTPRNQQELQAFLGLLNFYSLFLKGKATVAEPLHRLLAKKTPWVWGAREEAAFRAVKQLLTSKSFLIQYNSTLPLVLVCDASPVGVGAVLSHVLPNGSEAPVAYYSRTLSSAERNYSQLDREALAAVAGVKKFHEYLFGRDFVLVTDHRPLLGLLAGDRPTPAALSPRFARWAIFLSAYSYRLVHRPGRDMGNADALSRCPLPDLLSDITPDAPVLLIDLADSGLVTSAEVARHTARDPTLKTVLNWVWRGWPRDCVRPDLKPFELRQHELFEHGGCLLWGDRVVIPSSLRAGVLRTLHEGHPGIVRMKALARGYVWWPNMDSEIQKWVGLCKPCQDSRPAPPKAPVHDWEQPKSPWSRLHADFAGPVHGQMFFILVDAYSKWLEVFPMASTNAEAVIKVLRRLFATHGIPDVLVTDNGPQFTATTFEGYLAEQGIRHALSSPYHPASNGLAERFVRSAKEALGRLGPGDWQARIDKFLTAQHITPSATTGRSPAELLMGRRLRSVLDRLHPSYATTQKSEAAQKPRSFSIEDSVFARNYAEGSLWLPGTIEKVLGPLSYEVRLEDGRLWKRHVDQLRSRLRGESFNPQTVTPCFPPLANSSPGVSEGLPVEAESQRCPPFEPVPSAVEATPSTFQELPCSSPGAAADLSAQAAASPPTELRRSSRAPKRPAYLRDYVCWTAPSRRGGVLCSNCLNYVAWFQPGPAFEREKAQTLLAGLSDSSL